MEKKRFRPLKWILCTITVLIATIPIFICTMLLCSVRFGTVDTAAFYKANVHKGDTFYCLRNNKTLQEGDIILYCQKTNKEILQVVDPHYSGEAGAARSEVLVRDHTGRERTVKLGYVWGKIEPCETLFKIGNAFFPKFRALSVLE